MNDDPIDALLDAITKARQDVAAMRKQNGIVGVRLDTVRGEIVRRSLDIQQAIKTQTVAIEAALQASINSIPVAPPKRRRKGRLIAFSIAILLATAAIGACVERIAIGPVCASDPVVANSIRYCIVR